MFALALLNASIIGAAAVTLASSYAFGDAFGRRHSLHHSAREARAFHGSFAGLVTLAAAIVLIPGAPLGTMTTAVQALAGVLLPSATVFLVLLCNDKAVLGPWTNPGWLNALAALIVGVLVAPGWHRNGATDTERVPREEWTMPQLELLERPVWSRTRIVGMYALRGYLVLAVVMLVIKAIEVSIGQ
jgi:Natural resistance-associated macrophage protein-like